MFDFEGGSNPRLPLSPLTGEPVDPESE
jgi:hypothetical protein